LSHETAVVTGQGGTSLSRWHRSTTGAGEAAAKPREKCTRLKEMLDAIDTDRPDSVHPSEAERLRESV
jgi:hypothetical protein